MQMGPYAGLPLPRDGEIFHIPVAAEELAAAGWGSPGQEAGFENVKVGED